MENKDQIAAGNALIGWFNSQEIAPADAKAIMSKVVAKLLVADILTSPDQSRAAIDAVLDRFDLQLIHDMNDRLHHVRRR